MSEAAENIKRLERMVAGGYPIEKGGSACALGSIRDGSKARAEDGEDTGGVDRSEDPAIR